MDKEKFDLLHNQLKEKKELLLLKENSDNTLKDWLEYKFSKLNKKNVGDLDVSEWAMVVYAIELITYQSDKYANVIQNIELQNNEKSKFSIKINLEMRGDWLTSPLHIIKTYMGLMWEENPNTKNIKSLFSKISKKHFLYAPIGTWESYVYENVEMIWNDFDEEAKLFLKNVLSIGNFIMMPIYINPCRCKAFGGDDTLDTLLWKMYCCFKYKEENNMAELMEYLKENFVGDNEELARNNVLKWMDIYKNSWNTFVKYNYLDSMVEKNKEGVYGKPIDLRSGKPINIPHGAKYNPEPRSYIECLELMKNYNDCVSKRTEILLDIVKKFSL